MGVKLLIARSRGTHGRDHQFPLGNIGYKFVSLGNLLAARCCLLIYLAVSRGCRFVLEQPDGSSFPLLPRWQELLGHIQVAWCKVIYKEVFDIHLYKDCIYKCIMSQKANNPKELAHLRLQTVFKPFDTLQFPNHFELNNNCKTSTEWMVNPSHMQVWSCSFWMGAIGGNTAKRHRLWSNCITILNEVTRQAGYLSRDKMLQLPGEALVRKYVDANGIRRHAGIPGKLKQSQYFDSSHWSDVER